MLVHQNKRYRIGATLQLLGYALKRVGQEFKDIDRAQKEPQRDFDVMIYVGPFVGSEKERYMDAAKALTKLPGMPPGSELAVSVPRTASSMYARVKAPSAESAAGLASTLVREVLQNAGLSADEFRTEVVPATGDAA